MCLIWKANELGHFRKEGKHEKQKILIGVLFSVVIGITALDILVPILLRQAQQRREQQELLARDEHTTLEKIAYDKTGKKDSVYIKENGEYTPYLVVESDYGGNVLLLREYVIPSIQYQPSPHGEATGALSAPWTRYDYGSYYEESSIDKFLNTDFLELLSPQVQAAIVDTTIEVTDMESYQVEHWADVTHLINRKVFLLSAVELGAGFSIGYNITEEGTVLKYFDGTEYHVKNARAPDGTIWPNWTRTPWIKQTCFVTVIGIDKLGSAPADSKIGARPAFCMGKDTSIHLQDGILADKSVYVLDLESE